MDEHKKMEEFKEQERLNEESSRKLKDMISKRKQDLDSKKRR